MQPWKNYRVVINPKEKSKKFILDDSISPKAKTPTWWVDYNSVKHNRTGHYQKKSTNYAKANLRNLFYAFAALFILEQTLIEKTIVDRNETLSTDLESKLFADQLSFYTNVLTVH